MMESNTDRMYFTIAAVIVAGLLIAMAILLVKGNGTDTGLVSEISSMMSDLFGNAQDSIDAVKP